MVLDRVKRIAQTGEIPADNPVENIMAQVNLSEQQPQDSGLWGSLKNWAGTNAGRMALGGLGTALGVGLTGGNFKDALGYGIIGAGNTAKGLYNHEQDRLKWQESEALRKQRQDLAEKGWQLQRDLQTDRIAAQRELAKLNYNKAIDLLVTGDELAKQRELDAENRSNNRFEELLQNVPEKMRPYYRMQRSGISYDPMSGLNYDLVYGTPEEQAAAAKRMGEYNKLMQGLQSPVPVTFDKLGELAKNTGKTFTNESLNNFVQTGNLSDLEFADKPTDDWIMIRAYMAEGMTFDEARRTVGNLKPEERMENELRMAQGKSLINRDEHAANAGVDYVYQEAAADNAAARGEAKANNDFFRTAMLENFKNGLASEERRKLQAYARFRGISEDEAAAMFMDTILQKQMAEAGKLQKEAENFGKLTPGELQTGVNNKTISADKANEFLGEDIFQTPNESEEDFEAMAAVDAVEAQLNEFEKLFDKVPQSKLSAYTGGFFRDLTGTLTPDESNFNAQRTLLFNKIARDLGGEKGVLSDQDIKRVEKALPTIYDSPEQRRQKMKAVYGLVNIRRGQISKKNKTSGQKQGVDYKTRYGLD